MAAGYQDVSETNEQIFDATSSQELLREASENMLEDLFKDTWMQLVERQSDFELFLPDDERNINERTEALSQWCDGFLHGIVTGKKPKTLKEYLNNEPINLIIKDFLEITRASVNEETDEEENLVVKGRHDPVIGPRAVAVVEAMATFILTDLALRGGYLDD